MVFTGVCIETDNVKRLVQFYEMIFQLKAEGDNVHSSFNSLKLAIYNPGNIIKSESIKNFVLMYEVNNVDEIHERLISENVEIITPPEDKPWGIRALSLLDPDGNRVNLLSWI